MKLTDEEIATLKHIAKLWPDIAQMLASLASPKSPLDSYLKHRNLPSQRSIKRG